MSQILIMPKLGLTMTEGGLAQWLIKPGEPFKQGAPLFVLETEKVANEIEASADGVIDEILVAEGEVVPVGTALARWTPAVPSAPAPTKPRVKLIPVTRDVVMASESLPAPALQTGRIVATPYARKMAKAAQLNLAQVTTARVRITAEDVRRALKGI